VKRAEPRATSHEIRGSLKDFSFFPDENELLFLINVEFEITAVCDMGNELTMAQCTQVESDEPILDIQVDAGAAAPASLLSSSRPPAKAEGEDADADAREPRAPTHRRP
jgi:hypothetical protein